ncbi:MAG TPA: N-acetylmuramoyl-L-alanine amidase [Limnochordales bacterium]
MFSGAWMFRRLARAHGRRRAAGTMAVAAGLVLAAALLMGVPDNRLQVRSWLPSPFWLFTRPWLPAASDGGDPRQPPVHPASPGPDRPLAGVLVAVDPGHGGSDRGACHLPSGLVEKEINLDMALRLERALKASGAEVILTRRDDTFVSLDDRAQVANERGAHVFLSLHVNRYPSSDCFGAQTFYFPSSLEGRRLALLIQEELLQIYPPNYRQALPGNYRVLRVARMPAALVEIGFVTNATDRALMQREDYREAVAAAVVRALIRFVRGEAAAESAQENAP